jgi:threonylcarbamoyladenosine tRNA methylthiotransferase MtaB
MFENTLASVDECGIDYLHVFPYSPRPGTPAAKMPQLARDVVKARAARLREKAAERLALRLDRHVGKTVVALVEKGGRARLPDFSPVRIDGASPEPGRPALFHLAARTAMELVGRPVEGAAA